MNGWGNEGKLGRGATARALLVTGSLTALACGGGADPADHENGVPIPPWPPRPVEMLDEPSPNDSEFQAAVSDAVVSSPTSPMWRACGGVECADIIVPLDRHDAEGETLRIAINRVQASTAFVHRGVIIVN